jgi:4-amino-4-deoxy-L-arabinose transferase-like glycosyltransferase
MPSPFSRNDRRVRPPGAGAPNSVRVPIRRRRSLQAALLCLAAFVTAAAVAVRVFDAMPHLEDEQANLFQAMIFARGEVAAPAPPSPDAFFIPFTIIRNGIWFGKYPPGYPFVLALGVLLGAPWIVNAAASALVLAGVFLLGRDLFDAEVGLLAAALGAVSPAFVILSGSLLPHPLVAAALVFFAWGWLRARRPNQPVAPAFALLAGAALGLAAISRPWTALAVALPFIALSLFDLVRGFRRALRIYLPLGGACMALCALLPLYNYAVAGDPFINTYTLWWSYDTVGFGTGIGIGSGHTLPLGLLNAYLDLSAFQTAITGWPAPLGFPLAILPLGFGLVMAPRSRRDALLVLPPILLILAYLAYWARSGEFYGGRYYSEGMPFLWLLAARGLIKFSAGKWRLRLLRAALPAFLAWSIAFQINPRFVQGRGLYQIDRRGYAAVAEAGLHNALVIVGIGYWTDYANFSWLNSPFLDGDVIYTRDLEGPGNGQIIRLFPGREVYYYSRSLPGCLLIPYDVRE